MELDAPIYVAGHRGLVGSAIVRALAAGGYRNVLTRTHAELALTEQTAVRRFFADAQPQYVFLAAAKVGGILANNIYPADFIAENLAIQTNVIDAAWRSGVWRLLFLGSSCIYPRDCPQPIREEYLLTGPLEPTNRPYALAKIAGIEMCWSYNRQHGTRYLCAMPTNLYGPGDSYDLQNSHVLPALVRKIHEAKLRSDPEVVIWGTGTPRREFLYSDDAAAACVFLMNLDGAQSRAFFSSAEEPPLINVGCGEDQTIIELAAIIKEIVGYEGTFRFDASKPDGTMRKLLDVSRLKRFGWHPHTALREGIKLAYADYKKQAG